MHLSEAAFHFAKRNEFVDGILLIGRITAWKLVITYVKSIMLFLSRWEYSGVSMGT